MARIDELREQIIVMNWARSVSGIESLQLLHSIPNGGHRSANEAIRLKASGVLAGIPDLFLPAPSGNYHGLYLELKRVGKSSVSPAQRDIIAKLRDQGYRVEVCKGAEAAVTTILDYLQIPDAPARLEEFRKLTQVPRNA